MSTEALEKVLTRRMAVRLQGREGSSVHLEKGRQHNQKITFPVEADEAVWLLNLW
jgi:hypothetical protein